jgi:hypothetical protein
MLTDNAVGAVLRGVLGSLAPISCAASERVQLRFEIHGEEGLVILGRFSSS